MREKTFAVIGGDLRSVNLAIQLRNEGNKVNTFGFRHADGDIKELECASLRLALEGVDIVVGPVPFSNDNNTINAPFHQDKINICDLLNDMTKEQILIGGRITKEIVQLTKRYDVNYIDIIDREDMTILTVFSAYSSYESKVYEYEFTGIFECVGKY